MFSIENFISVLYFNLLKPANFQTIYYFYPFGSTDIRNLSLWNNRYYCFDTHQILAYDQEPILTDSIPLPSPLYTNEVCKLLANSEHSQIKKQFCKNNGFIDWYYFYHGFASLYWFNDWKYFNDDDDNFLHSFINLNRLVVNDRSYRLLLVSKLIAGDLHKKGLVSLSLIDHGHGTWKDEIKNPQSKLTEKQKKFIVDKIISIKAKSLIVDTNDPFGHLSAASGINDYRLMQKALWHVVSETVFYYDKLHLTEKIFKPIACKRPFILVAAQGNLAYLKSYGFKTFDKWIDESYDLEQDNEKRLNMIVSQIDKIANLDLTQLRIMHKEMQETLDYNFKHFFNGGFKKIIVKELVDNFYNAVHQHNHGLIIEPQTVPIHQVNYDKCIEALCS